MSKFGILISDLNIEVLNPSAVVFAPIIELLLRLMIGVTVTLLVEHPFAAMVCLNILFVGYGAFILANNLFKERI